MEPIDDGQQRIDEGSSLRVRPLLGGVQEILKAVDGVGGYFLDVGDGGVGIGVQGHD